MLTPKRYSMYRRALLAGLALATLTPASLMAAEPAALRIEAPYVRLAPPNAQATGAFMRIHNSHPVDRALIRADSPVARSVELHNHVNEQGMMKMVAVEKISVPARGQAELKPGSYHIMLIDMKAPLKEGEAVPITLTFDDGSSQRIDAPVRKPHDGAPAAHGHGKAH